jgi:hypothetical protein
MYLAGIITTRAREARNRNPIPTRPGRYSEDRGPRRTDAAQAGSLRRATGASSPVAGPRR